MTSTADTDQHPEVAEISALTEGLLPPDRTADVQHHLASCELCSDVRASLDEIRGLLGTLPGPARMPADIAGRIDAALAAEALLDSTAPSAVSRETQEAENEHVSRETAGTPSTPGSLNRPEGHPQASTGPGRRSGSRRRWRSTVLGAACALAALGFGGVIIQSLSSSSQQAAESSADRTVQRSTGPSVFAEDRLEAQVHQLLPNIKREGQPTSSPEIGIQSSPEAPLHGNDGTAPACVRQGTGRTEAPLAAQPGTFKGSEAYLVVLPHGSDNTRVDAYVIDASCLHETSSQPGTVLLKHTYPRD